MLTELMTSRTRVKILELLLFNQDSKFYLREIAKKIGITPIYVKKELENLERLNLVLKSRKGNLTLFQINEESPIFAELKSIFLKTEYFEELIKESLENLKIDFAFIFGSFARGTESEASDIDLFIVGEVDENDLLPILYKVEKRVKREINYILWKKKLFVKRAKKHHLLNEIARGPVIMLVGDEDEVRRIIE